jgi:hypothetical protein
VVGRGPRRGLKEGKRIAMAKSLVELKTAEPLGPGGVTLFLFICKINRIYT